jgi:integrase
MRVKRDGKWKHLSLQTADHTEACAKALNYCDNPHPGKRAKTSFAHYADIMGDKWRTGSQPIYPTYFGLLNRWVQPYFNKYQLKDIGAQTLVDYYDWFEKKLGRRPAKSTINHHNTVIRAIFDRAANDKIINRGEIPKITIKGHGRANSRRPHFDIEEVERMMGCFVEYVEKSDRFITKYKRRLLHHYVSLLLETGMRPGKEIETLTWQCIDEFTNQDQKKCVRIWIREGKRGFRKPIANDHSRFTLARLFGVKQGWSYFPTDKPWEWGPDLTQKHQGELLFAMPDGGPFTGASEMFKKFLIEYGMLCNPHGETRSLYSCRHSFITFALVYRTLTVQEIAAQCGTSIEMISRHYAHVLPEMAAGKLSSGVAHHLPYKL